MNDKKRLGDLLIEAGFLNHDDLHKALRLQVAGSRRLGYLLIKMGFISEDQLQSVLSQQLGLPIVDINSEFERDVKKLLPKYLCRKYSAMPLALGDNNTLKTAMVDPSDAEAVADIERYTGKVVQPVLAAKSDIINNIRNHIPWSFKDIVNTQASAKVSGALAVIALILGLVVSVQFYNDKKQELYGNVTRTPQAISYENLELIVGFTTNGKINLLGRGAYSPGYYSITFDKTQDIQNFIRSNRNDFSERQLAWLNWAITNPEHN